MRLLRNALTAARHPTVGLEYARWRVGQIIDRPFLVKGAFGTRLQASTYGEFVSTRGFVPGTAEIKMIRNLGQNCRLLMDIGANVGVWTVALAAAYPQAKVYTFEPTPSIFNVLRRNIALNRLENVVASQLAVSDAAGVLSFQSTDSTSIFNRLAPRKESVEDARGRFTSARTLDVESVRLDDFCRDRKIDRIGFLKLDVEGAEVGVLRGAESLLRSRAIGVIWVEVEPDNLREMGDSVDGLAEFMKHVGYTFHHLQPDGSPGPAVDIRHERSNNMVARPA